MIGKDKDSSFPRFAVIFAAFLIFSLFAFFPSIVTAVPVDQAVLDAEVERISAINRVRPTVLAIFGPSGQGGGSGVVISPDGYALSNFHVTKGSGDWMKCGMADGRLYDAVIVGIDPTGDVALLKLLGREDFPAAELGDSDAVRVGEWAFAMGNPFLLATDFQPTVTYGIVSGVHRYQYPAGTILEYADCIQADASINPGNSGGPLFNARGELIGINGRGSFEKRGRVNVGVGYAISINQIKNFMGYLRSGRIVDHATLGARVASDEQGRVIVQDILETADAYRRGLRAKDEIVSFAGRPIATVNAFKNALGIFPRDWRVPMTYRRDGQRHEILVRLAGVHSAAELVQKVTGRAPREAPPPRQPDPEKKPPERPGKRAPRAAQAPAEKPMPPEVRKYFESRSAYANYYFNRLNRDRVWAAFVNNGDFDMQGGAWTLAGETAAGLPVKFVLDADRSVATLPIGESAVTEDDDLGDSLEPAGSGGLLLGLHLWRRLLVEGTQGYGDVYYLGTVPLPGQPDLADVLIATHGGVECRFYFAQEQGRLIALELFPADGVDPAEFYFSEYHELDGRLVPGRMEIRHGDEVFATLKLTAITLARGGE